MCAVPNLSDPREGYVPVGSTRLFYREIGAGHPILILHGGPDFDQSYLLPDMDRLAGSFRLVYYDARGRGRSADGVQSEDVTLESEIEDLEAVREHCGLACAAVLGHSWGGLLAMEYALRYPERVSHLILLNTAPASRPDYLGFREARRRNTPADMEELDRLRLTAGYRAGDPDAVAAYYRVHYRSTLRKPEHLEQIIERLRASFTREGILKARAVEHRLMDDTWLREGYDLFPALGRLRIRALVLHGEYDFVPVEPPARIAVSLDARLVILPEVGHFSYLEAPDAVCREITAFLQRP